MAEEFLSGNVDNIENYFVTPQKIGNKTSKF